MARPVKMQVAAILLAELMSLADVNSFPADRRTASRHPDNEVARLGSSRIGRNAAINVGGAVISLLISLATVPAYLHLIGETRFGVLAIVWVVLGYFGAFDLGLSRATAHHIARMQAEPPTARERVFWTALSVNAAIGAIGGVILFFVGNVVFGDVVKVTSDLRAEALAALPWLAIAVPLTTLTLVLAGSLEGGERFLAVNSLAVAGLAMFQLAPLAYAYWIDPSLDGLIMSATLALATSTVMSFVVASVALPVRGRPRVDRNTLSRLLRYGGWITITGLVSPLLTVLDRLVIGGVLGAKAVTRYTVAFALVSRTQIVSSSLARTVFPRFSMLGREDAARVSRDSLRGLAAIMTPLAVVSVTALEPFLQLWVGEDIASSAAPVGAILLMGMWVNSMAVVPFAFLQAQGRPDLPAKFHLLELAPYIVALILGLHLAGIQGAAWAWSGRVALDAVLLFSAAWKISKASPPAEWRHLVHGGLLTAAACIASLTMFHAWPLRIAIGGALIVASLAWAWRNAPVEMRLPTLGIRRS
jgi:O-antigen/teichoic acid export membrane protein